MSGVDFVIDTLFILEPVKRRCNMKKLANRLLFVVFKGGLISLFLSLIRVKLGFWTILVMLVYLTASEIDRLNSEYKAKSQIFKLWRRYNDTVNK